MHEQDGKPCQDVLDSRRAENGNQIVVISDGAGGALFGAEAAEANTAAVLDLFDTITLDEYAALGAQEQRRTVLDACLERLAALSRQLEHPQMGDFSATLLFFVSDGTRFAAGHLGDGMMLVQDSAGQTLLLSHPENQGVQNRTWFTVSRDATEHLRITHGEGAGLALMMSDGPYYMCRLRGGSAVRTAEFILDYTRQGKLQSSEDLSRLLDRLVRYPIERADDWSMAVWSCPDRFRPGEVPAVVSMLAREQDKYEKKTESGV